MEHGRCVGSLSMPRLTHRLRELVRVLTQWHRGREGPSSQAGQPSRVGEKKGRLPGWQKGTNRGLSSRRA